MITRGHVHRDPGAGGLEAPEDGMRMAHAQEGEHALAAEPFNIDHLPGGVPLEEAQM